MTFISESRPAIAPAFADRPAPLASWRLPLVSYLRQRDRTLPDQLLALAMVGDALSVLAALLIGFWIRFHSGIIEMNVPIDMPVQNYAGYIAVGTSVFLALLGSLDLYSRTTLMRFRFLSFQVLKATLIWSAACIGFSLFFHFSPPLSRIYAILATILAPSFLIAWRFAYVSALQRSSLAAQLRQRVAFFGWNEDAERLAQTFSHEPGSAFEVVGCVASRHIQEEWRPGVRVLGHAADAEEIISELAIDLVLLADATETRENVIRLANICEREMVQFKVIPSYFQILLSGLHLETVSGIPILGVTRLPLDKISYRALKRAVDLVGATIGLLLSAPLILAFGALVYWESPGPILYRQRRLGRKGAEFDIFKIRSMKLNAEAGGQIGWSTKGDPRRLRIGSLMRRWNIDEVPQFWNVLKGEMSLVGPRPERPELIRNFKHEIPHYNARHCAKPGITGWAQVKGLRGDTDLGERIRCDLWYLENWSLLLDTQIMFMTFVKNENAA